MMEDKTNFWALIATGWKITLFIDEREAFCIKAEDPSDSTRVCGIAINKGSSWYDYLDRSCYALLTRVLERIKDNK